MLEETFDPINTQAGSRRVQLNTGFKSVWCDPLLF